MEVKMETIGKVEAVKLKDGKYGVKVANDWYNGFGEPECVKGDYVTINWKQNGNFKNVMNIDITPQTEAQKLAEKSNPSGVEEATRLRRKTDILLKVIDGYIAGVIKREEILPMTNNFVEYIEGKGEIQIEKNEIKIEKF